MTYNDPEKYCVRVKCNGNIGSGVLIAGETTFYVFTAAHCLGKKEPEIEDILIEKQNDYKSVFENIKIVAVKEFDYDKDYALIEIDFQREDRLFYQYNLAHQFIAQTDVKFCGYQGVNNGEYRPFPSKIITISDSSNCFKIKLTEGETFHQGGEFGRHIASGLSGSGLFTIRHNTPFLIGILNSVVEEQAWNNDINCCSVHHIENYFKSYIDLSDLNELRSWTENLEKTYIEKEIIAFKDSKSDFFEKLNRKNKVIYSDIEKANSITTRQIKRYLSMLQNIRLLENEAPHLYIKFKSIVAKYVNLVEEDYTRSVNKNNEALDLKQTLQNRLKDELDFLPIKMDIDFADFQIIEWLGMCTLNFTKND
ncbi:serine protease [Polaribacter sp. Z014]|uniref:trypsin-like serine protease n=1 Tax=Polaribacter sp. Z014 TaxID=2927126 RepID=UPI00202136AC|nr:trypsin-like serine protease [Polaribacter sp. Z014]MCL7762825.1 serine protease [Polaribacter sp. Z014]